MMLPFKSIAGALLLSVFFGPVGLLYANVWGGVIMILLSVVVVSNQFVVPMIFLWLISCIWAVMAVERYNKKMITHL